MKPVYELLHDKVNFYWNNELETLFQQIKRFLSKCVTLNLSIQNHPIFTVDFFLIGRNCVLFQLMNKGKLDVISYKFRISTTKETNSVLLIVK